MSTLHAKSPCCHTLIYRFGKRRRQCSNCKKTWSSWKKKRGRKSIRVHVRTQTLAFASHESLRHRAQRLKKGRETLRRRHAVKMNLLIKNLHHPSFPEGRLIAIIDGYQLFFSNDPWTLYLLLLRPLTTSWATVIEPCLIAGQETIRGWEQVFEALPQEVLERIQAVVSDGTIGIEQMVRSRGWVMQRCHIHLLRVLRRLLGNRWDKVEAKQLRKEAYEHVITVLTSSDKCEVQQSIVSLRSLAYSVRCPRQFGLKLRGFLRSYEAFRSYHMYPELNLPTTTNSAEAVCGKIAELNRRTRSFRNPQSFEKWVKVQVRLMPKVQCRGQAINRKTVS